MNRPLILYKEKDIIQFTQNLTSDTRYVDGVLTMLHKLGGNLIDGLFILMEDASGLNLVEKEDNDIDGMVRFDLELYTFTNVPTIPFYWESESLFLFSEEMLEYMSDLMATFWNSIFDENEFMSIVDILSNLIYCVVGMAINSESLEFTGGTNIVCKMGYIPGEAILISEPYPHEEGYFYE